MSVGLAAESSSDSENDNDEDDDDEVEDSEGGEETCPSGCDSSLYDKVTSPSCLLMSALPAMLNLLNSRFSCRQGLHIAFHGFCLASSACQHT